MKKLLCSVLAAVLLCASLGAAFAEPSGIDQETAMRFFSGVYGNIAFELPGMVERIRDVDLEDAWTDSWQLMGYCLQDGAEFQLHMADIAPLVGYFKANYPDDSEDTCRLQALMNYGLFMPNTYGIDVLDAQPHGSRETGNLWLELRFVYHDNPDAEYIGRFLLSGTQAACLVMLGCEHARPVADALRFVTDEERESLLSEKHQVTWYALHGLEMTFPSKPIHDERDGMETIGCFTEAWSFMQVSYYPYSMILNADDASIRDSLITIAQEKMLVPYETDQVLDPVYSRPAEHTAQLDFRFVNRTSMGDYGQKMLGRLYVGEYGIWYVYTSDDEDGKAFLDSMALSQNEPDASAETMSDPGSESPSAEATGRKDTPSSEAASEASFSPASTLKEFRAILEGLMNDSALGFRWKPGNLRWCDAVFSGGEWMRAVFSPDAEGLGAALIRLDSSDEDAKIRGITMLRYADYEEWKDDWLLFAGVCALALRGDPAVTEEHLDPEESVLVYDRVQILPLGDVPPVAEDIPYPEQDDIDGIPDSGVTVAMFEERFRQLTDYPLSLYSDDGDSKTYLLGSEAGVMVYTDGEGDDAQVDMVVVMGLSEEAAPVVVHGTVVSFGALAGMSSEEAVLSSYVLMETPLWNQLCDLWPLMCRGSVCAHLQESGEIRGMLLPMGFVSGRPVP